MVHKATKGSWNNYTARVRQDYPEIADDEFHATEGWYDKVAHLLIEKYGMTHEEATEKAHEFAKEVDYDENAVDDDEIRSFKLDSNSDHTGKMTDIL